MPSWLQNLLSNELVKAFLQSLLTIGTLVAIGRAIWKWLEERKRERSISRAAPDIHVPLRPDRILRGRGAERAELKSYFEKHNLVVIQGIAGVGKTKLGEAFAQHVADTTDFRLVWIGCRPAMGLGSLMSNLAVHIATRYKEKELGELLKDYRPADAIDWINKAVNALSRAKYAFFFDDFQVVENYNHILSYELIHRLIGVDSIKVIVLTREVTPDLKRILGDGANPRVTQLRLGGISEDAALMLLHDQGIEWQQKEEQWRELCRKVGGHPKALEICAGLIKSRKASLEGLLSLPIYERGKDKPLKRLLDETSKRLSSHERKMLMVCSVFDEPFGEDALQCVYPDPDWWEVSTSLQEKSLLTLSANRYSLHPLVQDYFYRKLTIKAVVHKTIAAYYLYLSEGKEEREYIEFRVKAHRHAYASGSFVLAARIASDIGQRLYDRGRYEEALDLIERTIQTVKKPYPWLYVYKAWILSCWGQIDEAEKTLQRMARVYDSQIQIFAIHELANLHFDRGEYQKAVELYERDLELCRKLRVGETTMTMILYDLAVTYRTQQ